MEISWAATSQQAWVKTQHILPHSNGGKPLHAWTQGEHGDEDMASMWNLYSWQNWSLLLLACAKKANTLNKREKANLFMADTAENSNTWQTYSEVIQQLHLCKALSWITFSAGQWSKDIWMMFLKLFFLGRRLLPSSNTLQNGSTEVLQYCYLLE